MDEQYYEKILNIKTSGEQKIFNESPHYNRYEPTEYSVLEILSKQYKLTEEDNIVDFGCGKGRLNFYINHFFNSTVTGIEMNTFFYKQAIDNKKNYLKKHKKKINKIHFVNTFAEEYYINPSDNKFYFFNPFSIQIFTKVIGNIVNSIEGYERTADLILYYPSYEYIYFLESRTPFILWNEIKLPFLYDNDPRHNLFVYRLDYKTHA
ncbi:methyltransferase [Pelosinus propionicus]|uniref:Methyltransferase domain-containing protein n=1 Tax=Pelosinus propionicus DSM 13327 TaxID=1123291 RepID=A0A1I4LGK5_9FIRM|nr:methyltransferase [Pelosinus propionicus]SFL90070.1 Methyltransferase domain-containing protein [Pelosinus propionicus DSM 13327]